MRLIDADSVLKGIEELKKSPWFNRGKEVVSGDPGFQHIGYIERKEAVDAVRDLCIHKEPTVGGWINVKDRLPVVGQKVLTYSKYGHVSDRTLERHGGQNGYDVLLFSPDGMKPGTDITHWMPLPEPPKE